MDEDQHEGIPVQYTQLAGSENCLRIMVATDTHLGVWEKDELRKDDSFRTFEEVFKIAREYECDMVLLGGDLFHDNKPSRTTLVKTMKILREHCMFDRAGQNPIEILNSEESKKEVFVNPSGCANFEDPSMRVGLPVFTIHGNHDDPTGAENLSAVDILAHTNLLTYFGKFPIQEETKRGGVGKVTIKPVLLRKGGTQVALYGLGNIRDERLGRVFRAQQVTWQTLNELHHDASQWSTMFVLHQNRREYGAKSFVENRHIPPFVDYVVWGHEHDCRVAPEPNLAEDQSAKDRERAGEPKFTQANWTVKPKNTLISQPGSTVATSLSAGEAIPKHCLILDFEGTNHRYHSIPLKTVRPFVYDTIRLADKLPPSAATDAEAIEKALGDKLESMIRRAQRDFAPEGGAEGMLPLIRLRVDYTGFSTVNSQRFGQRYVGRVANPHDILLWAKQAARRAGAAAKPKAPGGKETEDLDYEIRPEDVNQATIEAMMSELLADDPAGPMTVLLQDAMDTALHLYVDKEEKDAIKACVESLVTKTSKRTDKRLIERIQAGEIEFEDLAPRVEDAGAGRSKKAAKVEDPIAREVAETARLLAHEAEAKRGGTQATQATQAAAKAPAPPPRASPSADEGMRAGGEEESEDDGFAPRPPGAKAKAAAPPKAQPAAKKPATGKPGADKAQRTVAELFTQQAAKGGQKARPPPPSPSPAPSEAPAARRTPRAAAARAQEKIRAAPTPTEDEDNDDIVILSDEEEEEAEERAAPALKGRAAAKRTPAKAAATPKAAATKKSAAARGRKIAMESDEEEVEDYVASSEEEDIEDEDLVDEGAGGKKRKPAANKATPAAKKPAVASGRGTQGRKKTQGNDDSDEDGYRPRTAVTGRTNATARTGGGSGWGNMKGN